jgi:hypothetical protein
MVKKISCPYNAVNTLQQISIVKLLADPDK